MRTTMNISFPNDLYRFIRVRAHEEAFASTSEYIRALVREDLKKHPAGTGQSLKAPALRKMKDIMADVYADKYED